MASGRMRTLEAGVTSELPQVGDWVLNGEVQCEVRFVGETQFAKGVWIGVALTEPNGKNNGTVQGISYFECEEKCGLFVRPAAVSKISKTGSSPTAEAKVAAIEQSAPEKILGFGEPGSRRSEVVAIEQSAPEKILGFGEPESRRSQAQMRLSMAIEEHDIGKIKELLPMAQDCGVRGEDVANARELVAYAGRNVLIQELTDVRLAVERLGRAVQAVELRAEELEQSSKVSMSGRADLRPNAKASDMFDPAVVEDWLSKLGDVLEKKVWTSLEKKVTQVVHESVLLASRELIEAASSVRAEVVHESVLLESRELIEAASSVRAEAQAAQLDAARHGAATTIQRTHRGRIEHKAAQLDAAQQDAATTIQRTYRGRVEYKAAQLDAAQQEAATKIQRTYRGRVEYKASQGAQEPDFQAQQASAATLIQRIYRGQHARGQLWGRSENGFYGATLRLRARHQAWADIFDDTASQDHAMDAAGFDSAIRQIYSWVSAGQANAVWMGYVNGAGKSYENDSIGMSFDDFCCVAKAGVNGEEALAEFADISLETFQLLGRACPAQVSRIQATLRGKMARREQAKRATAASQLQAFVRRNRATRSANGIHHLDALVKFMRSRHKAWVELFEHELSSGDYPGREVDQRGFVSLLTQIQPAFSSAQAAAVYDGYTKGCRVLGMDLRGFCTIAQAIAGGDMRAAAEFADLTADIFGYLGSQEAERAAIRMQAARRGQIDRRAHAPRARAERDTRSKAATQVQSIYRRWKATRCAEGRRRDLREAAVIATRRVEAWGELYDVEVELGNIDFGVLNALGFANVMSIIQPALSKAQVHAMFKGFVDTVGAHGIDFESLCHIAEEVITGDMQAGARIADMPVATFTQLGSPEALAAAQRIQAAFRGGKS